MDGNKDSVFRGDLPHVLNHTFSLVSGLVREKEEITLSDETQNETGNETGLFGDIIKNPRNQTWFGMEGSHNTGEKLYDPPIGIVILLCFLYGTICLIALVGNLSVLWLVLGSRRMWTVTNMFISNLAFADIIMAIFIIPFHFQAALFQRWVLPEWLCSVCPFVQIFSVSLSVGTLSILAIHRYKFIMRPLQASMSKRFAVLSLVVMWVSCFLIALPTGMDYFIIHYVHRDGTITVFCQNVWWSETFRTGYNQLVVITQYFLPLVCITFAYARMIHTLWNTPTPGNQERCRDAMLLRKKKKVTKMLLVVVILFGACWLPYQMYNFVFTVYPAVNNFQYINMIWFAIHWLAMSNSCCNPFIYGIYNEKFRQEFRHRLTCLVLLRDHRSRRSEHVTVENEELEGGNRSGKSSPDSGYF